MGGEGESLAHRTRRLLAETGVRPKRSRGQSFLIDPRVADRVAELATTGVDPGDLQVLEIGAGLGGLTEVLAERASRVVAIEIEHAFADALKTLVAGRGHVTVVEADALTVDMADLCGGVPDGWMVAGNLPYHAATAIVLRLLRAEPPFKRLTVMVQREVGERLLARAGSGSYGSLSVTVRYFVESGEAAARVPPGAFHPQPRVDSLVLVLKPRRDPFPGVADERLLFAVIRAGFAKRRKQLVNALVAAPERLDLDRARAREAIRRAGLDPKVRAEELDLEDFVSLGNALRRGGVRSRECA